MEQFQSVWAEGGWPGHVEAPIQLTVTTTVAEWLTCGALFG